MTQPPPPQPSPSHPPPPQPGSDHGGPAILPHNLRAASVWNAGGADYEGISRSCADAIDHAVVRLAPRPGERVLDVATGTGWAARRVAHHGAAVVGVDLGEDLVAAARAQAARLGIAADYRVGDAEALPFAEGSFDAVLSTFGVMFASRPEAAAAELARVCRPGGRLVLLTWLPDGAVAGMFQVLQPYLPAPPGPPPPSPFAWGREERVGELLGAAFDLRFERGENRLRTPDGAAVWELFSTGFGPVIHATARLDEPRREAFRRDFIAYHERFRGALGIDMPRGYLLTHGRRR